MKKTGDHFKTIISTLVGIMIGGVTVVGANQAIQAIQNEQIKVSLNGRIQTFVDELTGDIQYPITYQDRTYLPLRNIAQLLSLSVSYDNDTKTAILEENSDPTIGEYFSAQKANSTYFLSDETFESLMEDEEDYYENEVQRGVLKFYDDKLFFYNDGMVWNYFGKYENTNDTIELNFIAGQYCPIHGGTYEAQEIDAKVLLKKQNDSLIVEQASSFGIRSTYNMEYPIVFINKNEVEKSFNYLHKDYKFSRATLDNSIVVQNGNNKMNERDENQIRPGSEFYVFIKNEYININEISYWFDNNKPTVIGLYETIPAMNVKSPYKELNVKIKSDEEEKTFNFKLDLQQYIVGVLEERRVDEKGDTIYKVNGKEYIIDVYKDREVGEIVFLEDFYDNNRYVALSWITPKLIPDMNPIINVTDKQFDFKGSSNNDLKSYDIEKIYDEYSSIVYIEYDSENNIKKIETSQTRNHEKFSLMDGDKVLFERANAGYMAVFRKYDPKNESKAFFEKE